MSTHDPRIDAYIAKSAEFARPILEQLRAAVHAACPEVEETIKWSAPHFTYKGMLCAMCAFKQHCAFHFWRGAQVVDKTENGADEAMGQFGRITSTADLPPRATLIDLTRQSMALIDAGVKPARATAKKPPFTVPGDMRAAIDAKPKARATFDAFPPSAQRDYVEWITEAKRAETRTKRLAQAVEWIAEGKRRNWKYENC